MIRLAHTADWHGGFRQFDRWEKGQNVRERDVQRALMSTMDGIIAAKPDLVLVAGDIHHSVRPPNGAVLHTFAQLGRLRAQLPDAPIVLIAGDHDSPRSSEAGSILPLFRSLGVHVVEGGELQRIPVPGGLVTAAPKWVRGKIPPPDAAAQLNILVAHGEARSVPGIEPEIALAGLDGYDYVALGHWHVCQQMTERAWYSGAIEFTSTDPWGELREQEKRGLSGKGFLLVDLQPGQLPAVTFQLIKAARRYVDVPSFDATGMAPSAADAAIAERLEAATIDGAVVRLVVTGVSREVGRAIDHAAIRHWKSRTLNLSLKFERPAHQQATAAARGAVYQRLDTIVAEFLGSRELPPDLDRTEFVRLGREYFDAAGEPERMGQGEK